MRVLAYVLFYISGLFLRYSVMCQTGTNAKDLRTYLFDTAGYDKKVRSATNVSNPTEVYVELSLVSLNGLDDATESLSTTAYLHISWYDSYLVWNASDYGGITYTFFPQDDVWKPDVALKNSIEEYKELGVKSLNVQVSYDGLVAWYPFQKFQSSCSMDITYFPYDKQNCDLIFSAWSYSRAEVDMKVGQNGIDFYEFERNSLWDVIDSSARVEEETYEANVIFTLSLKRKPRFDILNIVLPLIMLTVLDVLVFALPCDSGEKASYAVTVFLSFAVFLTIISSQLPKNSDTVSYFSVYVIFQTVQSTLITVVALLLIRLNSLEADTSIPRSLAYTIAALKCRLCANRAAKVGSSERKEDIHVMNIDEVLQQKQMSADDAPVPIEETLTWKQVANTLDLVFFCLFSLSAFLSTAICLGIAANA